MTRDRIGAGRRGRFSAASAAIGFARVGLTMVGLAAWAMAAALTTTARAEDAPRILRAAVDADLAESGLIEWLAPRFRFKTRIRIDADAPPEAADLLLVRSDAAAAADGPATPIASRADALYVAVVRADDAPAETYAKRLVGWLISDAGKRAITRFAPESGPAFTEPSGRVARREEAPQGDATLGERLALQHCGRCHVISEKNKYGGIGSTPSFPALRSLSDYRDKFDAFWTLNPHPSFTQVAGITEPFDPARPPHIAPVELTLEEVEAITAYVVGIPPKNLGASVQAQ